jgi:hypothetical protein
MDALETRAYFVRMLLEKVRDDPYPSTTQMDIIEQALLPEWIPEYLNVLLEKVSEDRYPSIPMLNRIGRLVEEVR